MYSETSATKKEVEWYLFSSEKKSSIEQSFKFIEEEMPKVILATDKMTVKRIWREIVDGEGKLAFQLRGKAKRYERIIRIAFFEKDLLEEVYITQKTKSAKELYERYIKLMLIIRRICFGVINEQKGNCFRELEKLNASPISLSVIIQEEIIPTNEYAMVTIFNEMQQYWTQSELILWAQKWINRGDDL